MPNDQAGSFPLPPTDNQPVPEITPEVKLTDEVAPDLSAPPSQPVSPPEPAPAGEPATIPANLPPKSGGHFPIITLLLLLISIGAIAATYFFYQQSLALNLQLSEISKTLEQQRIRENQATTTPTPSLTVTPTSTISATPTATQSGGRATPIIPIGNSAGLAFSNIDSVIPLASEKYPSAQLILLVATGAESPASTIIKYWFRQTLTDKKYLYVLSEPGKALSVIDHPQLYVRADNNIPSLNQRAGSDGLGIDLPEAIKIAAAACPNSFDCTSSSIKAQYIDDLKLKTILWQISFTSSSGKLFVVQINATTKKIIIQYF